MKDFLHKIGYVLIICLELLLMVTISTILFWFYSVYFLKYFPFNQNLIIYTNEKIDNIEKERIKEYYLSKGVNYINVEVEGSIIKITYNAKKNEYIFPPLNYSVKRTISYPSLFLNINSTFILSIFHLFLLVWGSFRFTKLKDKEYSKKFIHNIKGLAIIFPTLTFGFLYDIILKYLLKYNFEWANLLINEESNIFLSFLFIVIFAPIAEEIYFRGYIFNELKNKINLKFAFLFSSFLFALIHCNFAYFIGYFFIGYFLAFSYKISKSIFIPISIHMIYNLIFFIINIP